MNGEDYLFSAPLILLAGFGILAIIAGGLY